MRRKKVNAEIRKDIANYWNEKLKANLHKRIRSTILSMIRNFELIEEPKIQNWAHMMVPNLSLAKHADRFDLKLSMRKYMRKQTIIQLGYQGYFPELFTEDEIETKDNGETNEAN